MSKVSIIVPVYNAQKVLPHCVESIINQDYKDIEILLMDDGSKDESFKIISEYAGKDHRIVPVHKENSGVSSTRNLAISMATGDYIQFIDADDWLPFDATKLMVRAIEEDNSDLLVADFYRVVDGKSTKKGSIRKGGVISVKEYADKMLLTPADFYYGVVWNKLYKKAILDEYNIRFDEKISMSEDAIFNLQYLLHVNTISILKSPVYYYVKTDGSLVAKNLNIQGIITMKKNVIGHYENFYREVFDDDEFEARRPVIYGFLVSVSTDSFAIPLIDEKTEVGAESANYFINGFKGSEIQFMKLSNIVFDRLLSSLGQANSLDLTEVKILYCLYMNKGEMSVEDIIEACEISQPNCVLQLTKLTAMSLVKISDVDLFKEKKIFYKYIPSAMDQQFAKIEEDYRSLCYDGLNEEDIDRYEKTRKHILNNIRKTIATD